MIDFEKYMIAEEGIFSRFKESKAKKAKIASIEEELKSMDPKKAAEKIISAVKAYSKSPEGQKNGYTIASDANSIQALRTMSYNYQAQPGMINPTTSELTTISGVKCIFVTRKSKETDEPVFTQLVIPVIYNGKPTQDVISRHSGAMVIANNM